jgi:hypothetical protein
VANFGIWRPASHLSSSSVPADDPASAPNGGPCSVASRSLREPSTRQSGGLHLPLCEPGRVNTCGHLSCGCLAPVNGDVPNLRSPDVHQAEPASWSQRAPQPEPASGTEEALGGRCRLPKELTWPVVLGRFEDLGRQVSLLVGHCGSRRRVRPTAPTPAQSRGRPSALSNRVSS